MNELRPYQLDMLEKIDASFGAGSESTMLALATGAGKTAIGAAWIAKQGGKVLFLCPTLSVIGQVPAEFAKWNQRAVPVGSGLATWERGMRAARGFSDMTIACTEGTAGNRILKEEYKTKAANEKHIQRRMKEFSAIVVDEAHHAADPLANHKGTVLYQLVQRAKQCGVPVLGLTATPWRMSKKEGFVGTWDDLIVGPQWVDLLGDYLANVDMRTLSNVKTRIVGAGGGGSQDFTPGATKQANNKNPIFRRGAFDVLDQMARRPDGTLRKTIMYAMGQEHALMLSDEAKKRDIPTGLLVSSKNILDRAPRGIDVDQNSVRERFRSGGLHLIINVNMVTEGYDCPDAECVIILRPTKSLALWQQMCGRGSRLSEDKDTLLLIDLTDNHVRLKDPLTRRKWTLNPRSEDTEAGDPFMRYCINKDGDDKCGALLYTSARVCHVCGAEQGRTCAKCGKHRMWYDFEYDDGTSCERCREGERLERIFARSDPADWGAWGMVGKIELNAIQAIVKRSTQYDSVFYTVENSKYERANVFAKSRKVYALVKDLYDSGENVSVNRRTPQYPAEVEFGWQKDKHGKNWRTVENVIVKEFA